MAETARIFVSHSHMDDAFTERLTGDLRGAGADVWVDNSDLVYDDFIKKINEGLTGRQWLVLVLTPSALASSWVHSEVNAALAMVHKGRMRGVIPILARSCGDTEIPPMWDALHRYDATSNYTEALAGLLRAMGLSAATTAPPAPSARHQQPHPTPVPIVERAMSAPAPSGRTLVVASRGNERFRTIMSAVNAADPGDRILIRPGSYQENVEIEKPLQLVGDGNRDQIVVEPKSGDPVKCVAGPTHIANMVIRVTGGGSARNAIYCRHSPELTIENCELTSSAGITLALGMTCSVTLRNNWIHHGSAYGVYIYDHATALLEENVIEANASVGVQIADDARATLRRNRIHGNKYTAISVEGSAHCLAEQNDLRGSLHGVWNIKQPDNVTRSGNLE